MSRYIQCSKFDTAAVLSICRPETHNALSRQVVDELDEVLEEIASDTAVKVLVVYSKTDFAAGADIKEMVHCGEAQARQFSFSPTYEKLAEMPIPTIAVMEGYALGGGVELALCCDIRIATETARIGFPEITLGIMPGAGGTVRLPQLIGDSAAARLIYTGETIDAYRAEQLGLVDEVCLTAQLRETVEKLVRKISRNSRCALLAAKQSLLQSKNNAGTRQAVAREMELWSRLFLTYDQKEGMTAFLEKRKPSYQNR